MTTRMVICFIVLPLVGMAIVWGSILWGALRVRPMPAAADLGFRPGQGFRFTGPVFTGPAKGWVRGEMIVDEDHAVLRYQRWTPPGLADPKGRFRGEVRLARADVRRVEVGGRVLVLRTVRFVTAADPAGTVSCTAGRRVVDELTALGWPTVPAGAPGRVRP